MPGSGMAPPALPPGRVLLRLELELRRALAGSYLLCPPFEGARAVRSADPSPILHQSFHS